MIKKYAIFVGNDVTGDMEQYTLWLTKESAIEQYKSMSKYLLLRDNARVMILKQVDPETGE